MTTNNSWFQVDRDGLRKLIEHRGKAMILYELTQNSWDATDSTEVQITATKIASRPFVDLVVTDDSPEGFVDLTHAYTLFAESVKKGDPSLRGRFNLGEKLVLALCKNACVASTSGTIAFNEDGTMQRLRTKTQRGSEFRAEIRMNQAEYDEFIAAFDALIPPVDKATFLNGRQVLRPNLVASFEVQLPTLIADDEGALRPTRRKTNVEVFDVRGDEAAMIYEMGIPIVTTGDRFHVNVGQKVPLNMDRDNVPPAYLRQIRAAVLNATAKMLSKDEAAEDWVTNALEDKSIEHEAVTATIESRFGTKRAIWDPTDREANHNLTGQGYTVITGGSLPKAAWAAVRAAGAAKPSGQIAPSPRPYSNDPNAPVAEVIPRSEWTKGMIQVEEISRWAAKILGVHNDLLVTFVKPRQRNFLAAWGSGLDWNVTALGKTWFDEWYTHTAKMLGILIHELAHSRASNHLDHAFHTACTDLGGRLAQILLMDPKAMPHSKLVREHASKAKEQGT